MRCASSMLLPHDGSCQVDGLLVPGKSSTAVGKGRLLHAIERFYPVDVAHNGLDQSGQTLTREGLLAQLAREAGCSLAQGGHRNAPEEVVQELQLESTPDHLGYDRN